MEENKNLWNKTTAELTVNDIILVNIAVPIITIGAIFAGATVVGAASKARVKLQDMKLNRDIKKLETNN